MKRMSLRLQKENGRGSCRSKGTDSQVDPEGDAETCWTTEEAKSPQMLKLSSGVWFGSSRARLQS